ncbi:YaaA family protein [Jatrophihabitans sp.]|uniref:YaaA family protein n=1 Tax=Jatrophihabitans sp. TaxID=1932789 RepID=UPI002CF1BB20|nr:peroxide stress protein YaaA [Jatrophihabitans sp.]
MRILLPPSEAKNPGGRGLPLARRQRRQPIEDSRELVLRALEELLAGTAGADPARSLLLPDSVADAALADNRRVRTAPTMPALDRYAGIVYDGLFLQPLSDAARAVANREVLIFSGLFGVLRGGDPVPNYRVPAKAWLPGLGVLSTFWRPRLDALVPDLLDRGPVLDLRSGDYAAMWQPAGPAGRLIEVRVLSPRPDGTLGVISFASKLAKGRLTAALLERRAAGLPVRTVADIAAAWQVAGGSDLVERRTPRGSALDLVTPTAAGPAGSTGSARAHRARSAGKGA